MVLNHRIIGHYFAKIPNSADILTGTPQRSLLMLEDIPDIGVKSRNFCGSKSQTRSDPRLTVVQVLPGELLVFGKTGESCWYLEIMCRVAGIRE